MFDGNNGAGRAQQIMLRTVRELTAQHSSPVAQFPVFYITAQPIIQKHQSDLQTETDD